MKTFEEHMRKIYNELLDVCPTFYSITATLTGSRNQAYPVEPDICYWIHRGPYCRSFHSSEELRTFLKEKQIKQARAEILYRKFDLTNVTNEN